jgi:hypothetical protein
MSEYTCLRCGYEDNYKGNFKKHLDNKNMCDSKISNISREECLTILKTDNYKLGTKILIKEIINLKQINFLQEAQLENNKLKGTIKNIQEENNKLKEMIETDRNIFYKVKNYIGCLTNVIIQKIGLS